MKARAKSSASSSRAASSRKRAAEPPLEERLFALLGEHSHEQVSFASDADAGYQGIIAIHSTALGPSLGGTRFWHYASAETIARDEHLPSYKAADRLAERRLAEATAHRRKA